MDMPRGVEPSLAIEPAPRATRQVLLVGDDAAAPAWGRSLAAEGLRVYEASRGSTAADSPADAVVAYFAHALTEQLAWLRRLAADHPELPLLAVCRPLRDMDQVLALEMGADDVVDAALPPAVVAARLRALWRRVGRNGPAERTAPQQLDFGALSLHFARREVTLDGRSVPLTEGEFEVLWLLALRAGHPVTREDLLREVRGLTAVDGDRSIDTRIYRIRQKLGERDSTAPRLRTIRNRGYLLSPAGW